MKRGLFLTVLSIISWSCDTNDNPFSNLTPEERDIVEKAYSKTYQYPPGFNFQQDLDGSLYYENTVSIGASQTSWTELSTGDKQQAKDWSETSSSTSAYYRDLIEERETEKYFEFKRVNSINTKDVILSRVHKSSYFIPIYDKFHPTNIIGTLKANSVNVETTKEFIEYIWTSYTIEHTDKVLEYSITDHSNNVEYNLKSLSLTYGDFGLCDNIEIKDFDFFVDKQSGLVIFESKEVKEIKGTCR